jgi:hypothetical protein
MTEAPVKSTRGDGGIDGAEVHQEQEMGDGDSELDAEKGQSSGGNREKEGGGHGGGEEEEGAAMRPEAEILSDYIGYK